MELKSIGMGTIAMFAIAFSACTANEEFEEFNAASTDNNVIGFNVKTSNPSRSAGSSNAINDFKVTALDGSDSYFGSAPLSVRSLDNGYSWTSDAKHYWPTNRPANWKGLTFVAFVEKSGNSFRLDQGEASFSNYEVPADVSRQSDLMYAVAKDVKEGNATLHFRHALSRISFTAQNNNPVYENIEIVSIELGGVKGKGTYLFPEESTETSATARTTIQSKGKWTIDENAQAMTYRMDNLGVDLGAADDNCHGERVDVSTTYGQTAENVMYLLPQVAQAIEEGASEGAYIKVTTKMTIKGYPESPITSEEIIPIDVNWKEGQDYNYNISWNAVPITFGVTIDGFRDVSVTTE